LARELHLQKTDITASIMSPLSRLLTLCPFKKSPYAPQNSRHMSSSVPQSQVATFAAGCFWGVEHIFLKQWPVKDDKGILKTTVGYTGGRADVSNPTYQQVCSGSTNHAEALRIEFDPSKVTYAELVGSSSYSVSLSFFSITLYRFAEYFYRTHDPTTLNYQGPDSGTRASDFFPPRLCCSHPSRISLRYILQYPRARGCCPSCDRGGAREALYCKGSKDCHYHRSCRTLV
jgi:peptide methionine sulfoxide reductase MsrA